MLRHSAIYRATCSLQSSERPSPTICDETSQDCGPMISRAAAVWTIGQKYEYAPLALEPANSSILGPSAPSTMGGIGRDCPVADIESRYRRMNVSGAGN